MRTNGSGIVDITATFADADKDNVRAKLEFDSGTDCDFTIPQDPTLDETDANATSTYGDAKIENDDFYQIGNATGWIETDSGANTVKFDWKSQLDLPLGNNIYCLRLIANDQIENQAVVATATVTIDNVLPSQPGALSLAGRTGTSITLQFGATSTDTHFTRYRLFYKPGVAAVTESDSELIDSDLLDVNFNGTATTSVSGLAANTQYSFKIYAYDSFGNKRASNQTAYTTNAPPTGVINSAVQKTDGSGVVDIMINVYDVNSDDCTAKLEYVAGNSCNFTIPLDPTLDENPANITSNRTPKPGIDNLSDHQIGTSTKIITSSGANTIAFDWLSQSDEPAADGAYCLRLTVYDTTDSQVAAATTTLTLDNAAPAAPENLIISEVSGISVKLSYGLPGSDSHFKEYKIFYKAGSGGVSEADNAWTKNDDPGLGSEDFGQTGSTTVTGLDQDTDYFFNIWIYDQFGNKASAAGEVSTTTSIVPSATWREGEDAPDPAAGSYLDKLDPIRVRIAVANSGDWDIGGQRFQLEYGVKNGTCEAATGWTVVPASASGEAFETVASQFYDDYSSTTARLANSEGYSFVDGYLLESPTATSGEIALQDGQYSELEYAVRPTVNANVAATYCFRLTASGAVLDQYERYPELSLSPPPRGSFGPINELQDASGIINIAINAFDATADELRAKLEYTAGAVCDFTSPGDPSLNDAGVSISASYGHPAIDNSYPYQIGTTSAYILGNYGTNTVAFQWQSKNDLPDADGTYCLRLTVNDLFDDSAAATTTVIIDNAAPTAPGDLSIYSKTITSVTLAFGATSTDSNFAEYRIYYKIGASGVTESDTLFSSSSDANLADIDFNTAATTTIGGLTSGLQYVFKIFAYDQFGNKAGSLGEVTTKLVPSVGGVVYAADGLTPILSAPTVSIVVDGVITDTVAASTDDGRFLFQDIEPPATGTPVLVYLDGGSQRGVTYMRYGGSGEINNFNIYANTVIVRHDDAGPISTVDINTYDSDQDSNIPCTVSGINYSIPYGVKLLVWQGDTFETGSGSVGLDDVKIDGKFEAVGEQIITVAGSWDAANGAFLSASSTVEFTATTSGQTISTNGYPFWNLTLSGAGGEWTLSSNATTSATSTIMAGTLIQEEGTYFETQSLYIEDGAHFTKTDTGLLIFEGPDDGWFQDNNTIKNELGNVQIGYSPARTNLNSDFTASSLTINTGDIFNTRGYEVTITNSIINNDGTYNCTDDKEGDGTITTLGTDWTMTPGATFTAEHSTTTFNGTANSTLNSGGHAFYNLSFEKSATATTTLSGYDLSAAGNIRINGQSILDVSSSNFNINAGGDWINQGNFIARAASTTFNAIDSGNTIQAGGSSFHNVEFNSASGGWIIAAGATSTGNWYITDTANFSVNSGMFIEVQGIFQNLETEANTSWSDSTLFINNGLNLLINPKTIDSSNYGTIKVGANTDIKMWNANAAVIIDPTGSLYSMDNNDINGSLYIWGDYHVDNQGSEYWDYATDFDGADISGSPRVCQVRLADMATTTIDYGTLEILGGPGASTTIDIQTAGAYGIRIASGTVDADNYEFKNLNYLGVTIEGESVVENLSHGDFELAADNGRLIAVDSSVVSNSGQMTFTGLRFATTTAVTGHNVVLNGAPDNAWIFTAHYGNLSGDNFDSDAGDPRGYLIWDDSPDFHPRSQDWQWFHDEENETPVMPITGIDVTPSSLGPDNTVKLRLTVNETDGIDGENVKLRLEYSVYSDFSNAVYPVAEIGSTTASWTYADGGGGDNQVIESRLLDDNTASGTHNESGESYSDFGHNANTAYEYEFTLYRNNALNDTVYYFRPRASYYDDFLAATSSRPVIYNTGYTYPSITAASSTLELTISGVSSGQSLEGVVTDINTTAGEVAFGELAFGGQYEGAQQLKVTTNTEKGYQLYVYERNDMVSGSGDAIQPISPTNETPGAWTIGTNPSGFGYHTGDTTLSGGNPSRFLDSGMYARFETDMKEVGYNPLPASDDTINMVYKLEVTALQEAGDYESNIVYVIVPSY